MKVVASILKAEPAVIGGLLGSLAEVLLSAPSWRTVIPALVGVIVRRYVTPAA